MKYIVMECHLSYAVVLDEEGRFLKVANRHYEVGQTVTEVIEMQVSQSVPVKKKTKKWRYSIAAMAACLMLVVTSVFQMVQMPCASIYMTINPEVRIDVNRSDVVVGLDGINADGMDLIEGYDYKKKDLDLVMDELVDLAIDIGYLHEGGKITLSLDANEKWIVNHGDHLNDHLSEHLAEKITVTIDVEQKRQEQNSNIPTEPIVIPVDPDQYGESDYVDDDFDDDGSDYGSADDAPDNNAQSDYDNSSDDIADDDGQTDYGVSDDSDYEESDDD